MPHGGRAQKVDLYVPVRLEGGGLDGIPLGAAIVGTTGADGLVEIDYELPTSPARLGWVAAVRVARRRRLAIRADEPQRVHPAELVPVGACDELDMTLTDATALDRCLSAAREERLARPWPA